MIIYKTKEEIEKIHKANVIIREVLEEVIPSHIKPGVSTFELDKIADDYIVSRGAKPGFKGYRVGNTAFPAALCISVNEEVVHGIPKRTKILKEGDIISIDVGTVVEGYYGDAAKTYAVGKVDEETQRLLDVTEKSLMIGIEAAKVGNRIGDIGNAVQKYVESEGFSVVRDYCGHGVGKFLHEDPQIPNFGPAGRGAKIEDGMVLAIEPMVNMGTYEVKALSDGWTVITKDKKKSAHFEYSVAIIDGKAVILGQK